MKEPSPIDKAIEWNRRTPLSPKEREGFGPVKPRLPDTYPYMKYSGPSKEGGPKGHTIEIGIKGKF